MKTTTIKTAQLTLLLLAGCLVACMPVAAQAQTTTIIGVTGDPVPGGNGLFQTLRDRSLNGLGQVGFGASLSGTSGGNADNYGIYLGNGTSLTEIAREGQAVPGNPGTFRDFSFNQQIVNTNNAGQVLFSADLAGTLNGSADNFGFYLGDGSTLVEIAREGQSVPGSGTLGDLGLAARPNRPTLNNLGQVGFLAGLANTAGGTTDDAAIYRGDGTALVQIARKGQAAFGGNIGPNISTPSMNEVGDLAFGATISGGPNAGEHILRGDGTTLTSIAQTGAAAPGGGVFNTLRASDINGLGQVNFTASLSGTAGGATDDVGLFVGDGTTLVQIVRENQLTPSGNGAFNNAGFDNEMNDSGQVAFNTSLRNTANGTADDYGLFRGDGNTLIEIIREGQVVPGGNGTFAASSLNIPYQPNINAAGQVTFLSSIDGTSILNDHGIFVFDISLGLQTVARLGDSLLGSTITSLNFDNSNPVSNNPIGGDQRLAFNDLGQVTYSFTLADGRSGIALWTIPEPSSALLVGLGAFALAARRRRLNRRDF